ncbi:MFS transporter [Vulcanisaeta sp. JCM 16159]|uniref:MFS transporter n=1 Tax=Vulcanisaeta sp. JCM 16159 TaxID=1295371 RepID=UPI0006D2C926|nr:MFS transporter [Vulcanisaeta sp. JCM 16159]
MAAGFYQPALLAILIDSLPPERYASGILVTSVLPQIPWLILPPIGGFLINKYGLLGIRIAYLFSAVISTAVSVIRHFTIKETLGNSKPRNISLRELLRSYYSLSNVVHLSNDLLTMYLITLITYIAVMPLNTLLSIYVVYRLELSTVYWGYLVSTSYAAYIVLGVLLLFYVDRYRSKLLIVGIIINTLGSAIGLLENVYSTVGYMLLLQIGTQLIMTAIQSELGNRINIDKRGYGMSLLITFQLIGQTIGSYVAGEFYRISTESLFLIPLTLSLSLVVIHLSRSRHITPSEQ